MYLQESNSAAAALNDSSATIMVNLQLMDFVDEGLRLPEGMTCVCPASFTCSYLGTVVAKCSMSFTIILSTPEFVLLPHSSPFEQSFFS